MPEAMLGEIRIAAWNYEPPGWMFCAGQTLAIVQYSELFSLIGTFYGGDGQTTFNLPDLRGRLPVHHGRTTDVGMVGGVEDVTLTTYEMPTHTHTLIASADKASAQDPTGDVFARSDTSTVFPYVDDVPDVRLHPQLVTVAGEGRSHENMPPFVCVNYVIAVEGTYPSRP